MARYSGNKSWYDLFITTNGITNTILRFKGNGDMGVLKIPHSIYRTGYFTGNIGNRLGETSYWTSYILNGSSLSAGFLFSRNDYMSTQHGASGVMANGRAVRCVAKSPLLFLKQARRKTPTFF